MTDLFDIGFVEHLTVLDAESNSIKEVDQLNYLRRCQKLETLTLKGNPVSQDDCYYSKLE